MSKFKAEKADKKSLVLIAGVAGFIGSKVAENLCDLGISVIGLDNFISGKEKHLEFLRSKDNFELIEADLQKELPSSLRRKKITHIINILDVFPHIGRDEFTLNELLNNSLALKNLLDLANRLKSIVVFTSSVDIYQGLASHENLQNYFDGPELTTYYSFLEAKRYGETLCREYAERFDLDIRIARIPEVYGPGMDITSSSLLSRSIRLVLEGKDLVMNEEGSREHQLIYINDMSFGLVKLLLAKNKPVKRGIFYFVNPERVSTLSIAYTLRELFREKNIQVEFVPQHQKVGYPPLHKVDISRTQKILKWEPKVDLTTGLERTVQWFVSGKSKKKRDEIEQEQKESKSSIFQLFEKEERPKSELVEEEKKITSQNVKKEKTKKGWLSLKLARDPQIIKGLQKKTQRFKIGRVDPISALLGLGIVVSNLLMPFLLSVFLALRSYWAFKSFKPEQAAVFAQQANGFFQLYQQPSHWVGLGRQYLAVENLLETAVLGARGLGDVKSILTPLEPAMDNLVGSWQQELEGIKPQEKVDLQKDIQSAQADLLDLKTNFTLFEQKLRLVDDQYLPEFLRSKVKQLKELVWLFAPAIEYSHQLLERIPILLGFDRSQRYIVILQNNTELRATGGFIGSYALFELDQGQISQFKVDDIYNPDGLLEAHEDPAVPEMMKKHLGVEFLGLRDANWWPDYSVSMGHFAKLYERATGAAVDGVIAMNLSLVQELLAVTGPVYLEAYDEEIDEKNVIQRAQLHAEVGFEPGSTQKKDFLAHLAQAVLNQLFSQKADLSRFAPLIVSGIASRNIMFYSGESDLQEVLVKLNWAGQLLVSGKDYLLIIDSNVGGNKANFWIKRTSKYAVDVDREGRLKGNLTITWDHQATSTTWPSGDYKNYVRVYLPKGVEEVEIAPELTDQIIYSESGKTVVSGLIDVPIQQTATVQIRYLLPLHLSFSETNEYSLVWQNQPGLQDEKVEFTLNLPTFLSSEDALYEQRSLVYPILFNVSVDGTEMIKKVE